VKEGKQKVQYVYRNFPTTAMFGRKAVEYMTGIFKEAGVSPKRVVLIYTNDLFGQTQARQFQAAQKALNPGFDIVEAIPFAENATDLSTEVTKAKALKPDIIAPVVRAITAVLLLEEIVRQRVPLMGIISPGTPGLYEKGQIDALREKIEHVMDCVPWPNFKNPQTQKVGGEYARRSGGKSFDTNSGYSYEAILVIADVLERARSTEGDAIVQAIKATNYQNPLMVSGGPIKFNDVGDNPNAATAVVQILGAKPVVVYPKDAAEGKLVFPAPKA
jgi:branched-chain amino acid transport system substrate-binding protein